MGIILSLLDENIRFRSWKLTEYVIKSICLSMSKHVYVCGYPLASIGTCMVVYRCAHVYLGKYDEYEGICMCIFSGLVCVGIYIYGGMFIMHICPGR